MSDNFEIRNYQFNNEILSQFYTNHYAKDNWPVVYILSDGKIKEAYIGETTDTVSRINTHLRHHDKKKLTEIHLITSDKFHKSATLDIEANLIKYMSGDGQYKLLNANVGIANHNYYQKNDVYWGFFISIWDKLRADGVTKHSISHINNSDLFKYSPYKTLTGEQKDGLISIITHLLENNQSRLVVHGGAGTGKTVLGIFLFKILKTDLEDFNFKEFDEDEEGFADLVYRLKLKFPNPDVALVVPMSSFRATLQKVFKNVKGLNASMVVGPSQIVNQKYDIILVDESHRLRRRVNLGSYFKSFDVASATLGLDKEITNELEWVLKQSDNTILFYDENQSIKPSDTQKQDFDFLKAQPNTKFLYLLSQFRVKGGSGYVDFISNLLAISFPENQLKYNSGKYNLLLFDSLTDMVSEIKARNQEDGLSRLIAGYAWSWKSKAQENRHLYDIEIEDVKLRWNSKNVDWVSDDSLADEVGCIHTTQGYDLNYSGIIFGPEISFDPEKNEIIILPEKYCDRAGKIGIKDPADLKKYILNIYKTILLRGIKGTYVYVCDAQLRKYFSNFIQRFEKSIVENVSAVEESIPYVNSIPLYDMSVAAGGFSAEQKVDDFKWIGIPSKYKELKNLFACTVVGESMNKVIPDGSVCLFRRGYAGSRNGKIVLVELLNTTDPDSGSSFTVKEYYSSKIQSEDGWQHGQIRLKPLSAESHFKDIVIDANDENAFRIVGVFEQVLPKVVRSKIISNPDK